MSYSPLILIGVNCLEFFHNCLDRSHVKSSQLLGDKAGSVLNDISFKPFMGNGGEEAHLKITILGGMVSAVVEMACHHLLMTGVTD